MRIKGSKYFLLLFLLFTWELIQPVHVLGQRINFSTWTGSEDISITSVMAMPELNFNQKQNIIIQGNTVNIDLVDNQAVAFIIEAPENFDVSLEIVAPTYLSLAEDPSKTIPFSIKLAYNNQQPLNEQIGKLNAIELPLGFTSLTFPINRKLTGPPGPPPTPISGTDTRNKVSAYVYVYGSLGPVGAVPAGRYSGDISLTVNITSYE